MYSSNGVKVWELLDEVEDEEEGDDVFEVGVDEVEGSEDVEDVDDVDDVVVDGTNDFDVVNKLEAEELVVVDAVDNSEDTVVDGTTDEVDEVDTTKVEGLIDADVLEQAVDEVVDELELLLVAIAIGDESVVRRCVVETASEMSTLSDIAFKMLFNAPAISDSRPAASVGKLRAC